MSKFISLLKHPTKFELIIDVYVNLKRQEIVYRLYMQLTLVVDFFVRYRAKA